MADSQPGVDENIQLAGFISTILKNSPLATPGRSIDDMGDGVAGRVPEEVTEGVMPEGTTVQQTQDALAEDSLSEEGLSRFQQSGGNAGQAISAPTQREIDEAGEFVGAMEPEQLPNEAVTTAAEKARRGFSTGLADEGDADDLIRMTTDPSLADGQTGIDFNFENFEEGEDINRVINAMSEIIANPIEAEKRGIRTNDETLASAADLLADEMGLTKKVLRKQTGVPLNAEEMTAVRILLQRSAKRLEDMARQIQAGEGSPALLVEFRRQMSIHAGIQMKAKGAQTEIARALQAFRIPAGADVPIEGLQAILNETGGTKTAQGLAEGYLKALEEGGQGSANKFARNAYRSYKNIWMEVYINGMLSYFPTHLKNALATPLFMTYNILADTLGAGVGTTMRAGGRAIGREPDPKGIYFGDVAARIYGYNMAFRDAWAVASKTFRDEQPATSLNKLEDANLRAIDSETLGRTGATGQAIDLLGRLIRLPGAALMAADDFWRVVAGRGELYEQALRQERASLAAGRTAEEARDDAMMVLLDPKFVEGEMDAASRYVTLTDDINGTMGSVLSSVRGNFLGKLLIPFAKAPTNAMRRVAENHPLMAVVSLGNPESKMRANLLGQNGARAQQRAMGRLALGSATLYQMHQLALEGRITGAMPYDEQDRKMLPPGWQPYSIVFRGEGWPVDEDGDPLPIFNEKTGQPNGNLVYVSYQGLEPVGALLGIAASTAQHQYMFYDPEDRLDVFSAGALATAEYFRDLPMLQGVGDVFRAINYNDPTMITDGFMSGTVGVPVSPVTSVPVPFSSTFRNINRLEDVDVGKYERPYDYYTVDDVRRLFDEAQDSDNPYREVPYALVGLPKNFADMPAYKNFHDQVVNMWNIQLMSTPWMQERKEGFAYSYDMLGNKKERGVPFSVNPSLAIWNSVTPFKMAFGEEVEPYHAELIRLGAPLTEEKTSIQGVKLDPVNRGELSRIAKNETTLPLVFQSNGRTVTVGGSYDFRNYLKILFTHPLYLSADTEAQINMVKNAESKFYKAALPRLLAMDGNENLARVFQERGILKSLGVN